MIEISFIIPAKNEINNITHCIDSINNVLPREGSYEIIVVDNGSTDGTQAAAKACDAIVLDGIGLSIAGLRNFAAEHAVGEILAFVDADVLLLPGWVESVKHALAASGVGLVGSTPGLPDNPTWVERIWYLKTACMPDVWERPWLASMNMALRRSVFFEFAGFNSCLITCEDVDFGLRLGRKYKIINDKSINAVHLGNAKTIKELYFKEKWRATSNYSGIFSHGFVLSEIPSLLWPILSFTSLVLLVISFVTLSYKVFLLSLFVYILFPSIKSMQISIKLKSFNYFASLMLIWSTYALSRLSSLCGHLLSPFIPKRMR